MMNHTANPMAKKADAGNGSKAIGRVIDASRLPSPDSMLYAD